MTRSLSPLRFLGLALTGFLALVALMRLLSASQGKPSSTETIQDINRARTWHLQGWRLVGGKKLPWELWGQTQPFFTHEKIGDCIRVTRALPQRKATLRDIYVPALPGTDAVVLKNLVGQPVNPLATLMSWHTKEVDAATGLPQRFVISNKKTNAVTAELAAEYNAPLPKALFAPLVAPGAFPLELAKSPKTTPLAVPGGVVLGKVFLEAQVTAQDDEGNIALTLATEPRVASGGKRLPLTATIGNIELTDSDRALADNLNGYYTSLGAQLEEATQSRRQAFFIRNAPLAAHGAQPPQLKLAATVVLCWNSAASELLREHEIEKFLGVGIPLTRPSQMAPLPYPTPQNPSQYWATFAFQRADVRSRAYRRASPTPENQRLARQWRDEVQRLVPLEMRGQDPATRNGRVGIRE